MAWNPSKEVAVARDAAGELDAPICIVLWFTKDGEKIGMSSYGKNQKLCNVAKKLGEWCYAAAMKWGNDSQ